MVNEEGGNNLENPTHMAGPLTRLLVKGLLVEVYFSALFSRGEYQKFLCGQVSVTELIWPLADFEVGQSSERFQRKRGSIKAPQAAVRALSSDDVLKKERLPLGC